MLFSTDFFALTVFNLLASWFFRLVNIAFGFVDFSDSVELSEIEELSDTFEFSVALVRCR